jgi:hypothetical protein
MKKKFNSSGLLLAMLFVACVETPIYNLGSEQESLNSTRSEDAGNNKYYWSGGRKIFLDIDPSKMIVGFDSEQELTRAFSEIISKGRSYTGKATALIDVSVKDAGQKLSDEEFGRNKIFAYKFSGYDTPFLMTGDIVMQPKEGVSPEEILDKYDIDAETVNKTDIGVIVQLKDWSTILKTANTIYESGMVDWCHPDFVSQKKRLTNDQYFSQQYYLKNTGQTGGTSGVDINVEPAWAISTGAGIRVAVVDDGVESHDDLIGRVLDGFTPRNPNGNNSNGGNGRPTIYGGHGQACAGIIAASHNSGNNSYIAGVAPDVDIIPINIFYGGETISDDASAIEYAWNPNKGNADVISNSWGYSYGPPANADVLIQEIDNAVDGCVVVFAAGNDHDLGLGVAFPASLPNVIAVGAIDKYGTICYYSCRGDALNVVAPSGRDKYYGRGYGDVYTLDRMGANGYEQGNYAPYFSGTSAACPQVAGIAALMLSANPDLTSQEVTDIIESTASLYPSRTNEKGYGLVDAGAAVSRAHTQMVDDLTITGSYAVLTNTTTTYRIPTTLPTGVNFTGWTVTPNSYTATGGMTNTTLSITFNSVEAYTIKANFTLPSGAPYSVAKTVNAVNPQVPTISYSYDGPPIENERPEPDEPAIEDSPETSPTLFGATDSGFPEEPAGPEDPAWHGYTLSVKYQHGYTYEWNVSSGNYMTMGSMIFIDIPYANEEIFVLCRVRYGNSSIVSDWSEPLCIDQYGVQYPYTGALPWEEPE